MSDNDTMRKNGHFTRPRFKWEWSLNTVVIIVGFAGGVGAWGYQYAELLQGIDRGLTNMGRIVSLEQLPRRVDSIEFRVVQNEREALRSISSVEQLQQKIERIQTQQNEIGSDVRVVKEILERLERQGATRSFGPTTPGR